MEKKQNRLILFLKKFNSLLIAFSGGADSAFLLAMAYQALNKNIVAVTATSPVHPTTEKKSAVKFAKNLGIKHIILQSTEMNYHDFVANKKNRCYVCKKIFFEDMLKIASNMKIKHIAHGANIDDLDEFRPGLKAAHEMKIVAPMVEAGLGKKDIRLLSKKMNLPTWNKPSLSCLATRIPYNTPLTLNAIKMVEQAENIVLKFGFETCRVKHHGDTAKIKVKSKDVIKILNKQKKIADKFKQIGFSYTTIDTKCLNAL